MTDPIRIYASDHPDLIGWHKDMSNEAYHSAPGLSNSSLSMIHQSINHYINRVRVETDNMRFGTAVHSAVLQPETWPRDFMRGPDVDRRTKEWKSAEHEAKERGLLLLPPELWDNVEKARDAVFSHPVDVISHIAYGNGVAESSLFTADPETGILLKARPDYIVPDKKLCLDLKTTKNASPNEFARSCGTYRYDCQQALYTDILSWQLGGDWSFKFIAVESAPPFNVGVYEIHPEDVANARILYQSDIRRFINWAEGYEVFTGYSIEETTVRIPSYMRRNV